MAMEDFPLKEKQSKQIQDYAILKTIGRGGFGKVYLCEDIHTKMKWAIKEIMLPKDRRSKIDPKAEIEIHKKLAKKSKRFVSVHDDFVEGGNMYMVMEYCEEGSIRDFVKRNGPLETLLATDVLTQLCDALKLMHEERIVHRDLTPNNVLIKEIIRGQEDVVKKFRVKVTDFGLSKETPKEAHGQFKTTLGTIPFMAPEVKMGKYTKEADVFSLGSLFYFLLTNNYLPDKRIPGKENQLDLGHILRGAVSKPTVAKMEAQVQDDLKKFLYGLLCGEENRIRLDEIDKHPFMIWFYTKRYEIDPELRELRSQSLSGQIGGRRLSRSGDSLMNLQQQLTGGMKRSNRDSALGSDHNSRSGSSRCRHQHIDFETGRCKSCTYRLAPTSLSRDLLQRQTRLNAGSHLSEPIGRTTRDDQLIPVKSAPFGCSRTNLCGNRESAKQTTNSAKSPWPFPNVLHLQSYVSVNDFGRCSFKRPNLCETELQLLVVLEKTASKTDQSIKFIFEIWQSKMEQQFCVFEPAKKGMPKPEKNVRPISKGIDLFRIRKVDELKKNQIARDGYDIIWGFYKLAESKINQAYCEEVINERKYRLELRWNDYLNLYVGPMNMKDNELKFYGRQKAEEDLFEEAKGVETLRKSELNHMLELAKLLREEVRKSVWRRSELERFSRNIRCTIYTKGYS